MALLKLRVYSLSFWALTSCAHTALVALTSATDRDTRTDHVVMWRPTLCPHNEVRVLLRRNAPGLNLTLAGYSGPPGGSGIRT